MQNIKKKGNNKGEGGREKGEKEGRGEGGKSISLIPGQFVK